MQCGRHVWNIEMSCLNIPTRYLQPQTRYEHQHLIHTSPSPLWGMWANVNLPQMPRQWIQRRKPDNTDSTTATRIQAHQYGFDNHDTSSTTPQVGTSQRWKPDDADLTTTRIWQRRRRFNNHNTSSTTTEIRRQWRGSRDVGRLVFTQRREIWDRLEGGKLQFWWYVANSFCSFLSADHPPRTPSVNTPRVPKSRLQPTSNTLSVPTRTLQLIEDAYPPSTTRTA